MIYTRATFIFALWFLAVSRSHALSTATEDELKEHLLVVYNADSADGPSLAKYYAAQRGIPEERVLALRCPETEEIDRASYNRTIRDPIDNYLVSKNWLVRQPTAVNISGRRIDIHVGIRNEIWAIVLIRGVPLKIASTPNLDEPTPSNPALSPNNAAVDSELAGLPVVGLPLSGVQINSYYASSYSRSFDGLDSRNMILVTRLDGPTAADVRRMIDDSIYAESFRLVGRACLDARGLTDTKSGYFQGDTWLRVSADRLRRSGWPVEWDEKPEVFPEALPWSNVAIYAGWYTGDAVGPFMHAGRTFARGAIAYHIHSFSANTLRTETANWVGPLIHHGAAATMGAVYEPYLDFTPHIDIFLDRLLEGYSFSESAYASQRVLSWMVTVVGDPLYRPFRVPLDKALIQARTAGAPQEEWLALQDIRSRVEAAQIQTIDTDLKKIISNPNAGVPSWEGYGDILSLPNLSPDPVAAGAAFEKAMNLGTQPADRIRNGIKAAEAYARAKKWTLSYQVYESLIRTLPEDSIYYKVPDSITRTASIRDAAPLPPSLVRFLP